MLTLLMSGVVWSLFHKQFGLYRYVLVVVTIVYVVFSFSHVDYFIASYNLSHMASSEKESSLAYLGTLSSDAAPAIADYVAHNKDLQEKLKTTPSIDELLDRDSFDSVDQEVLWYLTYVDRIERHSNRSIRSFNVSQYIAEQTLALKK